MSLRYWIEANQVAISIIRILTSNLDFRTAGPAADCRRRRLIYSCLLQPAASSIAIPGLIFLSPGRPLWALRLDIRGWMASACARMPRAGQSTAAC